MGNHPYKIYCAGPLFNPKEREEMQQIASTLEDAGYTVFLPQRDGLEFARLLPTLLHKGVSVEVAKKILNNAIFSLDVFQIMDSTGLLLNMNGRVPDEGAMVEAGIAWAHNKIMVIFRSDDRSLLEGACNPLVLGLSDFEYVNQYSKIPSAFEAKCSKAVDDVLLAKTPRLDHTRGNGMEINSCLSSRKSNADIADLLINLFGERTCRTSKDRNVNCSRVSTQP